MKDWYMVFVLLAVVLTPFLPQMLKGKCPACSKRKLETLDVVDAEPNPFVSFHICKACHTKFRRERSGPMVAVSNSEPIPEQIA